MLTQDPIGLAGGVNLYAYAGNNPVQFSDPWGLDSVKFEGERAGELREGYDRAKRILSLAADGGDKDAAEAVHAMETVENSATLHVTFRVDASMGHSGEALDGNITINPEFINKNRDRYYLPLTVAHEFGHAFAQQTGRLGYSEMWALGFDNAARRSLHMTERKGHWDRPLLRGVQ